MMVLMAWRNIWRNKLRSIVIMLSIALGLFAGLAVLALYKGMMRNRVETVIYAEIGHLQLHDPEFKQDYEPRFIIPRGAEVLQEVSRIPGVALAGSRTTAQGMLATTTGSAGVQILGITPAMENGLSRLNAKMIEGPGFQSSRTQEILVGKKLATKMKLKLRSKLVLTFTDTSGTIVSAAFRVAGIYQSNNTALDEHQVYVEFSDLGHLLGTGTAFHEIVVLLKRDEEVSQTLAALKHKFPDLKIESWKEVSPETDLLVKTTDQYSYIIMIIIMIALAFGIINTMLMAVLERTREIGMMMALGTNKLLVFLLILLETSFLTFAGVPLGILAGVLVIGYYNRAGLDLSGMGKEMMSSFGFGTTVYPEFPGDKLLVVLMIVVGTALISCLIPAIKALKLQPVEALRR